MNATQRMTVVSVAAIALSTLAGCARQGAVPEPDYWPTDGWRTASPESQGFDSSKLAEGVRALRARGTHVHSLILIRDGYVLLEANFYPYDASTMHDLASVTKSVMTTLIGIAVDQGKLALDDTMVSFFPQRTIANLDERKQRITVRHLAGMTSGLECGQVTDTQDLQQMWASADWIQHSLDRPVAAEPGSRWAYCGPSIHLLSAILQQATGRTALDFAREFLFAPLGIDDAHWETDPQGYNRGWGDLALFPRDAAKLGLLMLHGGRWDGRQIVSEEWATEATTSHMRTNRGQDYGYGWWVSAAGEDTQYFSADGRGGQFVTVLPGMNLILATTGGGFEDKDDVGKYIEAAIEDLENPRPANPEGAGALTAAVAEVALGPSPEAAGEAPAMAGAVTGVAYLLEPNPVRMLWIRLDFHEPTEATMEFEIEGESAPRSIPVGLDGTLHTGPIRGGLLGGARGEWIDDSTFVVEYDEVARIDAWTMRFKFRGDDLSLQIYGRSSAGLYNLTGTHQ